MTEVKIYSKIYINGIEFNIDEHFYVYEYPNQNHWLRGYLVQIKRAKFEYCGLSYSKTRDAYTLRFELRIIV